MEAIIERNYGEATTLETRHDSYELIIKRSKRNRRYVQIIDVLDGSCGLTIREIIHEMMKQGYIAEPDRNYVAPRVNELMNLGFIEPCGKKKDPFTNRTVAVFRLAEDWAREEIDK